MKNYHEMATEVFRRRDEYRIAQKKKRNRIIKAAASVSSFCLLAIIGIGAWKNGMSDTISTSTDGTSLTDINSVSDTSIKHETEESREKSNVIVINKISSDSILSSGTQKNNICLLTDDFVLMNKEKLEEYYGTMIFPDVPSDLQEWDIQGLPLNKDDKVMGIYRRDGGKGEVYWDWNVINYSNPDNTRSVDIEVQKDGMPFWDMGDGELEACEKSTINGIEVCISQIDGGYNGNGYHLVTFTYKNVSFRIIMEGLSEEEVVSVAASLLA